MVEAVSFTTAANRVKTTAKAQGDLGNSHQTNFDDWGITTY